MILVVSTSSYVDDLAFVGVGESGFDTGWGKFLTHGTYLCS